MRAKPSPLRAAPLSPKPKSAPPRQNHFPELGSSITYHEVEGYQHSPSREHPQEMAPAHQLTIDRPVAAGLTDEEARSVAAVPPAQ